MQPAPLPQRVVRILNRQLRQRRRPACGERVVQRAQLTHEDSMRPAVRDDVMRRQQQYVLAIGQLQQCGPERRTNGKIESPLGFFLSSPAQLRLPRTLLELR